MAINVDELKLKVNIVEVIGRYVKLIKSANGEWQWHGHCPFHEDNKPSFFVPPGRGQEAHDTIMLRSG